MPRLWVKKLTKNINCSCASFCVGERLAGACGLSKPITLGINFIFGHVQCGSWFAIVILHSWCQCDVAFVSRLTWLTELSKWTWLTQPTLFNAMPAFVMKSVGLWWIVSWISSKSENFLWTVTGPRPQAVVLHRLWAYVFISGSGSENLWNQAKNTALFAELSCATRTREAVVFMRHASSEAHQQKLRPSLQILPCLEWNDACFLILLVESCVGLICCT